MKSAAQRQSEPAAGRSAARRHGSEAEVDAPGDVQADAAGVDRDDEALKQRVFKPLHLRGTSFPQNTSSIAGSHSDGHAFVDGKLLEVTVLNPSGTWAAGNLVSTATDVAHFWRALLGGTLLAPRQLAAIEEDRSHPASGFVYSPAVHGLGTAEAGR